MTNTKTLPLAGAAYVVAAVAYAATLVAAGVAAGYALAWITG